MSLDSRLLEKLACPRCRGTLEIKGDRVRCTSCASMFAIEGNIPILLSKSENIEGFDYRTHYERDSEQFNYFEERMGATAHSERRLREYILSLVPKSVNAILDVGCGSA